MTPKMVTIFGGSGFIGRQVVRELAPLGCQIRVAVRDPQGAQTLKPSGDVGQIVPMRANVREPADIEEAVDGADAVVNLTGILYESGGQTFESVHTEAARRIAEAAAATGTQRLVHMSALGVSPDSPSQYGRSKAAGEAAVRAAFPAATIVRPSVVFGPEDEFFNRFARMMRFLPLLPLIGGGEQKFQPVYVGDVADAIAQSVRTDDHAGGTYDLCGPHVYTFRDLMDLIMDETGRRVGLVPLPFELAKLQAALLELLPVPPLTRDQVDSLRGDNVCTGEHPGLAEMGIEATAAELILPTYLDIYRKGGRFRKVRPV